MDGLDGKQEINLEWPKWRHVCVAEKDFVEDVAWMSTCWYVTAKLINLEPPKFC